MKTIRTLKNYASIHHTGQKISSAGLKKQALTPLEKEDNLAIINMGIRRVDELKPTILQRLNKFSGTSIDSDFFIGNTPPKRIREQGKTQIVAAASKKKRKRKQKDTRITKPKHSRSSKASKSELDTTA